MTLVESSTRIAMGNRIGTEATRHKAKEADIWPKSMLDTLWRDLRENRQRDRSSVQIKEVPGANSIMALCGVVGGGCSVDARRPGVTHFTRRRHRCALRRPRRLARR